jgi:hypothetical protein
MKLLLAVLALVSAGTAAADCPKAADWARAFYSEHYLFYADAPDPILQLTTPEFGALLKKEWAYSKGEVGHFDYEPWLGAQDGEIGKPVRFSVETESPDMQLSPCHIRTCLTPSARPNGTRCIWYCARENMSAGTFTISSLRSANRCHMCTQLWSPNRALQPTGAFGALRG